MIASWREDKARKDSDEIAKVDKAAKLAAALFIFLSQSLFFCSWRMTRATNERLFAHLLVLAMVCYFFSVPR